MKQSQKEISLSIDPNFVIFVTGEENVLLGRNAHQAHTYTFDSTKTIHIVYRVNNEPIDVNNLF